MYERLAFKLSRKRIFGDTRGGPTWGFIVPITFGAMLLAAVALVCHDRYELAVRSYHAASLEEAERTQKAVEAALHQIYHSLRTVSLLPTVRAIDRHGDNLSDDAKTSIHQIYNNLAAEVAVSEVYIVPDGFDPDRIDPTTGKPEVPIMEFDELVTAFPRDEPRRTATSPPPPVSPQPGEAQEEIEIYEYRQLRETVKALKEAYPTRETVHGMAVPVVNGHEVITCDNREFNKTRREYDRMGVIFSVPFFAPDGAFKGLVSAIIRTNALQALLPRRDYALVNTRESYVVRALDGGQQEASIDWVRNAEPDPGLLYSAVLPITIYKEDEGWFLWSGRPDSEFTTSPEAAIVGNLRVMSYGAAALLFALALATWKAIAAREKRRVAHEASSMVAVVNERVLRKVSAEIHDGPAQLIAHSLLKLSGLRSDARGDGGAKRMEIENMQRTLGDALAELRSISAGLALPELETASLRATIEQAVRAHERRTDTTVILQLGPLADHVSHPLKICAYRFVQEALNNAFRHGEGKEQTVTALSGERTLIAVSDKGCGFVFADIGKDRLGLSGLKARIEALGGILEVISDLGQGTTVIANLPHHIS